jgi:hypothetical protein
MADFQHNCINAHIQYDMFCRIQRELVAIVKTILTDKGKPYLYVLTDLEGEELPFKFHAADLKAAPPLSRIKFVVEKVLKQQGNRSKVSFQYYSK